MEPINKTLEALLNKPTYKHEFVKLIKLKQEEKYDAPSFEYMKTKYKQKCIVILNDKYIIILSDNFNDNITNNYIEKYRIENTTKLKLIYNIMGDLPNGFKTHMITF